MLFRFLFSLSRGGSVVRLLRGVWLAVVCLLFLFSAFSFVRFLLGVWVLLFPLFFLLPRFVVWFSGRLLRFLFVFVPCPRWCLGGRCWLRGVWVVRRGSRVGLVVCFGSVPWWEVQQ